MIKFTIRLLIVSGIILLALYLFRFSIEHGGLDVDFRGKARVENLRKIFSEVKQKAINQLVGIWTVPDKGAEKKVSSEKVKNNSKSADEQISEDDRRELEKIIEEKIK